MFLYHYICLSISFSTPYSKLFYYENSQSYGENKTQSQKRWQGGEGYDEILWSALYFSITRKNQVLVLTFWIGKQNAEKHIEKAFLAN